MNGSHERDQAIERLLRQSLKTPDEGVTNSCLDAETLATWMDGGLSGAQLKMAESHIADCSRCRSIVGAVVRTSGIDPPPERAPRRWLAWVLPLAAAATAVALWVAVPRNPAVPATAGNTLPAPAAETATPADRKEEQTREVKEPASDAKKDAALGGRAQAPALREDAGRLETDRLQPQSLPAAAAAPSTADKTASAAAASPSAALADAPAAAPSPPPAAASQGRNAAAAPPVAFAAREAGRSQATNALAESITVAVEIPSPDPMVRWRIAGSVLQHSTNGGSSWDAVPTGITGLSAGAAPSATVCWVVGRGGIVLLSTDGRSFSRVAFPEMTDLSAVRATDARSASVSTMDGRTFSTVDGGATWQLR